MDPNATLIPGYHPATGDLDLEVTPPSLILLTGPQAGTRVPVKDALTIGRSPACDLCILQEDVSREHVRVRRFEDGSYGVEDLGSRNGTLLDGERVEKSIIRVGQRLRLGTDCHILFTHIGDLQDQILHQQKLEALGRLAGGVAHDFNNLLGSVLSNVCYLIEDLERHDPEEVVSTLEDIRSATSRAADLTRQLLGFARKGKYEHAEISVKDLVHDVLRILSRTTSAKIRLSSELDANLCVLGDRSQLHQVVLNLCINARDAMKDGGLLSIRAYAAPAEADLELIALEVTDTGSGMTKEVRERVFEPFFTTKELGQGTGLGLATAYGVVRNHGGEIEVISAVGRGTTFRVLLPRHRRRTDASGTRRGTAGDERATVLVVDDEDLHLRGSTRLLRREGYQVIPIQDGAEAIAQYRRNRSAVDVVLLDLRMPGMSGDEVAKELVDLDPSVRIVATSGYTDAEQADSLLDGRAVHFLAKPFTPHALERAIQLALRAPR